MYHDKLEGAKNYAFNVSSAHQIGSSSIMFGASDGHFLCVISAFNWELTAADWNSHEPA